MIMVRTYRHGATGWSSHGRNFVKALSTLRPVAVSFWNSPQKSDIRPNPITDEPSAAGNLPRIEIGIGPIDQMLSLRGDIQIGYIVFEGTRLSTKDLEVLKQLDRVWVPSSWGASILLDHGLTPENIQVVPEGVDPEVFRPAPPYFPRSRVFRFLCVGKWEVRKNIDDLVIAFAEEFLASEPVELVLHCYNQFDRFDHHKHVEMLVKGNHAPIVISSPVADQEIVAVYQSCDAFVLPTRAEGWGLPIAEALSCGLPVIATSYSAPMDYLSDDVAYLLRVSHMVPVRDSLFFREGDLGVWAQPDRCHLKELMRHIFEHQEEARHKGERARAHIMRGWSWMHSAKIAHALLRDFA